MTTISDILTFIDFELINPVLANGDRHSRRWVRFTRMCLMRLPPPSAILYCIHAAESATTNRMKVNSWLEHRGFRSIRALLPTMERKFSDVWPAP
jgi:hypothetical protein